MPAYRSEMDRWGFEPWAQLMVCLVADFIGISTYFLPIAGEAFDIVWAPIEAWLIGNMLSNDRAMRFYVVVGFTEEILPIVTDWLPTCTLAWLHKQGAF